MALELEDHVFRVLENQDALEWDTGRTPLRTEFGDQGRIARMTTSAGGPT